MTEKDKPNFNYDVSVRIGILVQHITEKKNDWKKLEELTGIPAVRWRHFMSGVTNASMEMFEALAKAYPQHAFWLATGLADYDAGHTAPEINVVFPGSLSGLGLLPQRHEATINYFHMCLEALEISWNAWMSHLKTRLKTGVKIDRKLIVSTYNKVINTSLQLRAEETTSALGKEKQAALIRQLVRAQSYHREETIERLREHINTDEIIDKQRKLDDELMKELRINSDDTEN